MVAHLATAASSAFPSPQPSSRKERGTRNSTSVLPPVGLHRFGQYTSCRRKSRTRPGDSGGGGSFGVPEWAHVSITELPDRLYKRRVLRVFLDFAPYVRDVQTDAVG